jgi:hypothetical protein
MFFECRYVRLVNLRFLILKIGEVMNTSQYKIKFAKKLEDMVSSDDSRQAIGQWRASQLQAVAPVMSAPVVPCRNPSRLSIRRLFGLKSHQ